MATIIVADTLAGIPVGQAKELGIPYLPQIVIFGEESYRDDSEIDSRLFLQKLRASPVLPKTAAPPPVLYDPIFQRARDNGDSVVVLCPSADLSGTYRSAIVASQANPEADIHVYDTRVIAAGLAGIVLEARKWALEGAGPEEIIKKSTELASRNMMYFLVDTLEYLHKGGRIGGAQQLFGSILQIKPILTIKDGKIDPLESQRTKNRGLARIKELVASECPPTMDAHLAVMHGDAYDEAVKIANELKEKMQLSEIEIYDLPPAILTHSGPGVIGVSFFKAK